MAALIVVFVVALFVGTGVIVTLYAKLEDQTLRIKLLEKELKDAMGIYKLKEYSIDFLVDRVQKQEDSLNKVWNILKSQKFNEPIPKPKKYKSSPKTIIKN